ncbi:MULTISPECIES: polymer-forming cytoskeletal protein [Thalassospira]|uniref:Uncharacterized protein n=2 Tax=Thalassospira TaxID=168934 RepID=A0A367WEA5_9PROT|nr:MULTISPECIES: polymer-forming cytoskeletal protein [Thalassospira]MDG4717693.1 hypothetical protein [Thalassospira sp. FZY0004]RCK38842.1 hypothetical protein TH19_03305 [Thalassospira profundimaris]
MITDHLIDQLDQYRRDSGFLTIAETIALGRTGNIVFDPFSTLVSRHVVMGANNILCPNIRLEADQDGELSIGNGNTFSGNTTIIAQTGPIRIGDGNIFGPGNITLSTGRKDAMITIGSHGRYRGTIDMDGQCALGNGSQILGQISAQSVCLADGGSFEHPIADERGAVLKGFGKATNIRLETGKVIAGSGDFCISAQKSQSFYHPEAR